MNKWLKISLLTVSVLVIGFGLMAFRGLGNPREGDGSNGHTAALAEALRNFSIQVKRELDSIE